MAGRGRVSFCRLFHRIVQLCEPTSKRDWVGYCPHTVTVYNRATIKVLMYLYYEYYSTVTEWGQYPKIGSLKLLSRPKV